VDSLVKQQIDALLLQKDYDRVLDLCQSDKHAWKALRTNLYATDQHLYWPSIEAIARLMQRWWQIGHEERVQEYIRGLFWSLNDESGGIGWNSPQTIAEIITMIPELIEPYGAMIIYYTMEKSLLVQSGLWAIGRLGRRIEPAVESFRDIVLASLESDDPQTLGLAAWAMGGVGYAPALPLLESLKDREEPVQIYIDSDFRQKTIGEWSRDAIAKITS
jgi:hypothetical protein